MQSRLFRMGVQMKKKVSGELGLIQLRAFKGWQQDMQHFRRRTVCLWDEE